MKQDNTKRMDQNLRTRYIIQLFKLKVSLEAPLKVSIMNSSLGPKMPSFTLLLDR